MEIARLTVLLLHFVGVAALVGGLLAQSREPAKRGIGAVRYGTGLAIITGVALVGILKADDAEVSDAKMAVKLGVSLLIVGLAIANRRREFLTTPLWAALLLLAVGNIAVALFWAPAHGSF